MNPEELKAITDTVGAQATAAIKKELDAYEVKAKKFAEEVYAQKGGITAEQFKTFKDASETALEATKAICLKQGTTLAELVAKMGETGTGVIKSIEQVLSEDKEELRKLFNQGQGQKTYMLTLSDKGVAQMKPFDVSKVGPEASVAGLNGGVSAISQALDAATLLRIGAGSNIYAQFRNTPWIFDLCNTINASFNPGMPYVLWFDEVPKLGGSATTLEGAVKPGSFYQYKLNSSTYKKEATLVGFTEEFQIDFAQLQSEILNRARIDVINRVNSAILPDIASKATPYNTEYQFNGGATQVPVPLVNDFDAIAAMAAQVDNATFGSALANGAIMSTFKKYRMGLSKNTLGSYLNPPEVLANIALIGNRAMSDILGPDALIVGDFKQYNIILRGGLIVRVGYNGTDFAQNMFSTVLEQFYFNYISTARTPAIVSGPDFATVRADISTSHSS